MKLITAAFR